MNYTYDYPRPGFTADVVVLSTDAPPRVLLIRRKHEPFMGMWAIPGGFVEEHEAFDAAARELNEETGLHVEHLEQLHTFGEPGRDPRGWTISVVYVARVDSRQVQPRAGDDALAVGWHMLDDLPALASDHAKILARARQRLENEKSRLAKSLIQVPATSAHRFAGAHMERLRERGLFEGVEETVFIAATATFRHKTEGVAMAVVRRNLALEKSFHCCSLIATYRKVATEFIACT